MTDREKLKQIVKRAAHSCLPSNTQALHINLLVTDLLANGVVVREKGEWRQHTNASVECPVCGGITAMLYNFCPNCGADMRKGENG